MDSTIQAFVDLSSGMARIIPCAAQLYDRMESRRNRGVVQVVPVVFRCFICQGEVGRFPLDASKGNPYLD